MSPARNLHVEIKIRILSNYPQLFCSFTSHSAFDNYFLQAQRVRKLVQKDFDSVFRIPNPLSLLNSTSNREGVDVLFHPSSVDIAPTLESCLSNRDQISPYVQDVLTVPASLAGIPSLSVPAGKASKDGDGEIGEGWPVGITMTSQFGCEKVLWEVGRALDLDTQ